MTSDSIRAADCHENRSADDGVAALSTEPLSTGAREPVELSKVSFGPILALAERVLDEAVLLADWTEDGPHNHATVDTLYRVVKRWLELESLLEDWGLVGNVSWTCDANWPFDNESKMMTVIYLHALVGDVRMYADWRKVLPFPAIDDMLCVRLAPASTMGMRHAVFARRVGVVVEQLRAIADAPPEMRAKLTKEEANAKAMRLAEADPAFIDRPLREWAAAIGCSQGLVAKLPFWQATMAMTGRGTKGRPPTPKAVSLTAKLEAVTTKGGRGRDELERLIKDQEADFEPSPVEDPVPGSKSKKVRCKKRA